MKAKFIPEFSKEKDRIMSEQAPPLHRTSIFGSILTLSSNEDIRSILLPGLKKQFQNAVRQRGVEVIARHLFTPVSLKELSRDPNIKKILLNVDIDPDSHSAEELVVDTILDKRVPDDLFTSILIRRAQTLEAGRGEEASRLAREGFDLHKDPLVKYLQQRLSLTQAQQELLKKRLDHVTLVQAEDPLENCFSDAEGTYDPTERVIRISMEFLEPRTMGPILIHEMMHAVSASLYQHRTNVFDENPDGAPETIDLISSVKTGVEIKRDQEKSFRFLNEGITETLASLYLSSQEMDPVLSNWSDDSVAYYSDSYQEEMGLCLSLHSPEHLVNPTPTQAEKLSRALQRATEAGVLMDENDFESLLFRAYLLDEYTEGEPGYAIHWRAWSKKMREYYGDGVLVELAKTWEAQIKKHRSPKQALQTSTQMLFRRFLQIWGT